jgi:hypothetical protein
MQIVGNSVFLMLEKCPVLLWNKRTYRILVIGSPEMRLQDGLNVRKRPFLAMTRG